MANVVSAFPDNDVLLEMITSRVNERRAKGIVLGVMEADGTSRIVSYGDPGPGAAPLGPDSVFEIASITKVFTGTVLADMAMRGDVSLDSAVKNHLPAELVLPDQKGMAITLANLAEQNSGLPTIPDNFSPADPANPFSDFTIDDLASYLDGLALPRAPGEGYEYSNLGVGLLGLALANQAGMSYEELVTQRILRPLGMTNTGVNLTPSMVQTRAIGHDQQGEPAKNWTYSVPFEGAGALRSNIIDMLMFLDANMGVARNELERAMRTAQSPRAEVGNSKIGLNWFISKTPGGVNIVYHQGDSGGYSSYLGFDPIRGVGVVMLANQAGVTRDIPVHLLDPQVPLREASPTPEQLGAIDLPLDSLRKFIGAYVLDAPPHLRLVVTAEDAQLYVEAPGLGKLSFYPRTPVNFFNIPLRAEITFVTDANGDVSGLAVQMAGVDQTGTKVE